MLKVKGPTPDFDGAFAAMKREDAEALVVLELPVGGIHRKKIAELAIRASPAHDVCRRPLKIGCRGPDRLWNEHS